MFGIIVGGKLFPLLTRGHLELGIYWDIFQIASLANLQSII